MLMSTFARSYCRSGRTLAVVWGRLPGREKSGCWFGGTGLEKSGYQGKNAPIYVWKRLSLADSDDKLWEGRDGKCLHLLGTLRAWIPAEHGIYMRRSEGRSNISISQCQTRLPSPAPEHLQTNKSIFANVPGWKVAAAGAAEEGVADPTKKVASFLRSCNVFASGARASGWVSGSLLWLYADTAWSRIAETRSTWR